MNNTQEDIVSIPNDIFKIFIIILINSRIEGENRVMDFDLDSLLQYIDSDSYSARKGKMYRFINDLISRGYISRIKKSQLKINIDIDAFLNLCQRQNVTTNCNLITNENINSYNKKPTENVTNECNYINSDNKTNYATNTDKNITKECNQSSNESQIITEKYNHTTDCKEKDYNRNNIKSITCNHNLESDCNQNTYKQNKPSCITCDHNVENSHVTRACARKDFKLNNTNAQGLKTKTVFNPTTTTTNLETDSCGGSQGGDLMQNQIQNPKKEYESFETEKIQKPNARGKRIPKQTAGRIVGWDQVQKINYDSVNTPVEKWVIGHLVHYFNYMYEQHWLGKTRDSTAAKMHEYPNHPRSIASMQSVIDLFIERGETWFTISNMRDYIDWYFKNRYQGLLDFNHTKSTNKEKTFPLCINILTKDFHMNDFLAYGPRNVTQKGIQQVESINSIHNSSPIQSKIFQEEQLKNQIETLDKYAKDSNLLKSTSEFGFVLTAVRFMKYGFSKEKINEFYSERVKDYCERQPPINFLRMYYTATKKYGPYPENAPFYDWEKLYFNQEAITKAGITSHELNYPENSTICDISIYEKDIEK